MVYVPGKMREVNMKGMLGHVSDSKTTLSEDVIKWRKLWRLRLIHWLAGDRAVLMNAVVSGLQVPVERPILFANAAVERLNIFELRDIEAAFHDVYEKLFEERKMNKILQQRLDAFCTEDLTKVEPETETLHKHDDHDSFHPIGIVHHGDNQDGGKYLVCLCGAKRGVRMVQVRLQGKAGSVWGEPQLVCLKCRRTTIRGIYRLC